MCLHHIWALAQSCKRAKILGPNPKIQVRTRPEPEKCFKPDLGPTITRNLTTLQIVRPSSGPN